MTPKNIIELLKENRYPTKIDVSSPLGYLLLRSFDRLIAEHHEWSNSTPAAAELFSIRKSEMKTIDVLGALPIGQIIDTAYALSVDETADAIGNCNYNAFCASIMNAWVRQRLPIDEIIALLVDARACVDYRFGVKGLHHIH